MLLWIVGICLFLIIVTFLYMFVRGADRKQIDPYWKEHEDAEQEKALAEMVKKKEHRK